MNGLVLTETVLIFQVSDRVAEVAVTGGPLTKPEIGMLLRYLEVQELIAPERSGRHLTDSVAGAPMSHEDVPRPDDGRDGWGVWDKPISPYK